MCAENQAASKKTFDFRAMEPGIMYPKAMARQHQQNHDVKSAALVFGYPSEGALPPPDGAF